MEKDKKNNLPMILVVLDGWGIGPETAGNAIFQAKTPNFDSYFANYPKTLLGASGKSVGLPDSQEGNSEAGHMNIGAGRVAEQDSVRISKHINDGTFFRNPAFMEAIRHVQANKSQVHLIGMLGNGMSAHSDPDHLLALIILLKKQGIKKINIHLFTDGRDSPRFQAIQLIRNLERTFTGEESINTIIGRFYAMDRKKYWPRTEKAYNALTIGTCSEACKRMASAEAAIVDAYNQGESDEFIEPRIIHHDGKMSQRIGDGDSVIFFNLRSDRARQIAKVFVQNDFNERNPGAFTRKKVLKDLRFVAMTDFGPDLDHILSAFPSPDLLETLPMQLAGLRQLYIAETEKYAHVTYFMNGGYADPVDGEDRVVIPSPNVKSYDETPIMSSVELTYEILSNLKNNRYNFTALNFAAPDMIGHTGNLKAAIKCCSGVDKCLGKIVDAYLKADGTVLITADHGNVEQMINPKTGEPDTEHTTNPVPFILVNNKMKKTKLLDNGVLGNISPTILDLLHLPKPSAMSKKSLISYK